MRLTAIPCTLAMVFLIALPLRAAGEVEVVASIAPVHSLVARVMQGVDPSGNGPYLLLPPGASPHDHALRPSDAAALERAVLVFSVGPRLEPWLERPLATLAAGARVVRLADTPGQTRLAPRKGAAFETSDHGSGPAQADDETDPHLWLDPMNAKLWLGVIAAALAEADPENRELYLANAEAARTELDTLATQIAARLDPVRGRPFVVFHDAFHYFEHRFAFEAAGAVALGDARAPGPARITRIRARIRTFGAVCLFREPQFRAPLVATVAEGTGVRIGLLDPLGANLQPGPDLYPALLRGLADSLADCLE